MHDKDDDHAAVRIPPPLVYLAAVIVGVSLHFALPLPLELEISIRLGVAGVAALLAVALMAGAVGLFKRTDQDPKPWKTTPEIITSGVYRFTRNPMYLSLTLLQIAIGAGLANAWVLLLVPIVMVFVYMSAIRHEEAYLEQKFGDVYTQYKATARRWI